MDPSGTSSSRLLCSKPPAQGHPSGGARRLCHEKRMPSTGLARELPDVLASARCWPAAVENAIGKRLGEGGNRGWGRQPRLSQHGDAAALR